MYWELLPAAVDIQTARANTGAEGGLGHRMAAVVEKAHVAAVLDAARLGIDGIDAHAGLVDLHLAQQRVLTVVRMHAEAAGAGGHDERILLRQRIGVEAAGRDGHASMGGSQWGSAMLAGSMGWP